MWTLTGLKQNEKAYVTLLSAKRYGISKLNATKHINMENRMHSLEVKVGVIDSRRRITKYLIRF